MASFQAVLRYLTSYDLWQKAGALFPEQRTCKNDTNKLNGIIICKSVPIWQSNSSQLLQSNTKLHQYEGKEQFPKTCNFSKEKSSSIFSLQSFASILLFVSAISASPVSKPDADGYTTRPRPARLELGPAGPAKPYSFAYEVIDPLGDANFGHRESSDGVVTEGEYRVALPDGRLQIVTYTASDATGYVADVKYEGTARFPEAAPIAPARLVKAAAPVPAGPAPAVSSLGQRGQRAGRGGRRGFAKRNENTQESDFKAANAEAEAKKVYKYKQLPAPQQQKPNPAQYYVPTQQPF